MQGKTGAFSRFILKTVSQKDEEKNECVLIIQNIHASEYLSTNNVYQMGLSKKYFDTSTHWKIIIKSQMLNGTEIVMFQSCLNQQLLAVNDRGMITSAPLTSMELKNTQFILKTVSAQNYSLFQHKI